MDFSLTILGSSSATPTLNRNQSSQVLSLKNQNYLIDCGESTQVQLLRYGINQNKIRNIFISHLHPDHFIGLIGFISSQNLRKRTESLNIFSPPGLKEIIEVQLYHSGSHLNFSLNFNVLNTNDFHLIFSGKNLNVYSFPLNHRIPCYGFLFTEIFYDWKINKSAILGKKIPLPAFKNFKQGKDFIDENGSVYLVDEYATPPMSPRSFAYITDTLYKEDLIPYLSNIDVLYHESTFTDDLEERAHKTFHSTVSQAATLAKKCNVGKLLIGHFSARYIDLCPLLEKAREIFSNTELALEGKKFGILKKEEIEEIEK